MGEMAELLLESQDDIDLYEEAFMNGYGMRNNQKESNQDEDEDW